MTYQNTVVYTINGFMGDMFAGPQADTGRYLSDQGLRLAYWQPIGYNAGAFPLSTGVTSGLASLQEQFTEHGATAGKSNILLSCWSEGACIAVDAVKKSIAGTPGWPPLSAWKGVTTFGNPYREAGSFAPRTGIGAVTDPGGAGIGGPRNNMSGTPSWWHDYAHPKDLYTCCPTNQTGDDCRVIYDFVFTQWSGALADLIEFATSLTANTVLGGAAVVWAIVDAIAFYGGGTADHINYSAITTGSSNYLAGIARTL